MLAGKDQADHLREGRFSALLFQLLAALRERDNRAVRRLGPRTVNFQIAHHDVAFATDAKINERIGHEHAHGVEHVCIVLAIGHHQQRILAHRAQTFTFPSDRILP